MSEMVERVVRALFEADGGTWPITDPAFREHFHIQARAAIAAMREITKEMAEAGATALDNCVDSDWDSDAEGNRYDYTIISSNAPHDVYVAMIDAALEPAAE